MYPTETFQPMSISSTGRPIARLPPPLEQECQAEPEQPDVDQVLSLVLLDEVEEIVSEGEDVDDLGGHLYLVSPEHAPPWARRRCS